MQGMIPNMSGLLQTIEGLDQSANQIRITIMITLGLAHIDGLIKLPINKSMGDVNRLHLHTFLSSYSTDKANSGALEGGGKDIIIVKSRALKVALDNYMCLVSLDGTIS